MPSGRHPAPHFAMRSSIVKPQVRSSLIRCVALCLGAALAFPAVCADNSALAELLKILRDKGTLTESEYQALVQAAAGDSSKAAADSTAVAAVTDKVDAMAWAGKIKLTGDMRNRYERIANDGQQDRSRARLRYRLGIIANPAEQIEVGAGLASGSADPRSSNQTFSDAFSSKNISLHYAYTQVSAPLAAGNLKAIAGKFRVGDYLWMTNDVLWDSDVTPEGLSLDYAINSGLGTTFVNAGVWVLGEFGTTSNDPYIRYGQIGQKVGADNLFATVAATYYNFSNIRPGVSGGLRGGNIGTFSAGSNTDYRFDAVAFDAELGSKHLFGGDWAGSVFGNVINNTDTNSRQDKGYSLGAKLGKGALGFKYIYANLDANGFPDIFPDSDRFGGATDMRSHELEVQYKIHKNVTVGLDYYHNERKSLGTKQDLLQTDISVTF
ncbi:MAG: hypothetical protein COW59_06650 [Lysobacterales bacterium CG17_big_fil_post_rev_8_21_14_2_50_64_11]|nr:MAG: hypothetical protein COW59_06650 [Xanthomonadales bacterium CG17_big_fil_post_rev_8_21_14_2_50_64_11]